MADDPRVSSAKLVVVDTVTKNFTLEFPGRERTGRRQGALGVYLNRIAIDAYLHRRVVLLTNRVASITVGGMSKDVNVGGLTLGRFVSKSIRLRREGGYVAASLEQPAERRAADQVPALGEGRRIAPTAHPIRQRPCTNGPNFGPPAFGREGVRG